MNPPRIACIVLRYPTLSQVFIQREIDGLRACGLDVKVLPCLSFPPAEGPTATTASSVEWLSFSALFAFPWRLICEASRAPGLFLRMLAFLLRRPPRHAEHWFHALAGFFLAIVRADYCRRAGIDLFHGAWATAPATAAAILARLCGKPFSFGAHAYDLYRHGGDAFLDWKLRHAAFVHTTTLANVAHLKARGGESPRIIMARRGLPVLPALPAREKAHHPFRILSIDRLVVKKGHIHQLAACRCLKNAGFDFQLRMVGDGPLRNSLAMDVEQTGLQAEVEQVGSVLPAVLREHFHWADVFWHTGVVDPDGDRDGLPNALAEAMAYGLPVIVSSMPGVMEAVTDGQTGLVVDATNAQALAGAVQRLAQDPELCRLLGANAREWVKTNFLVATNAPLLAQAFREAVTVR
jgi:glycosyltransferase involved in cell wall biosynthesis